MHKILRQIVMLLLGFPLLGFAASDGQLGEGMVNPGYHEPPSWFKTSFLDFREDLDEANQDKKRLILYFYQDGCPYCAKLLSVNWKDDKIIKKTRKGFEVIAINMWGDREITDVDGKSMTEKQFAEKNKVMYTPTLLFLNEKGGVALRVNGYYPPKKFSAALDYVAEKKERKMAFSDYYRDSASSKASQSMHASNNYLKPPYDLTRKARKGNKPLLVLYEQRWCQHCDELHKDILKRPESVKQLKRFDVVLLDRWGKDKLTTPSGKKMSAMQWAKELNVIYAPSLIFFDKHGKEVFRTEAYLKSFHIQSVMDYVASEAYLKQPNLQRYLQGRADRLEAQGVHVDLMQ